MIVIVDYGMGNLRSILNKLQRMDAEAIISSKVEDIEKAEKLILPGVGSFAAGMDNLEKHNLIHILTKKVIEEKVPILGICLGMQLLTKRSEEGNADGLGWIDAETKQFEFERNNNKLKVPHMGWNTIDIRRDSALLKGIPINSTFYFVHSYHVCCNGANSVVATTNYGYDFTSVIQKENIFGTQFHPEKSHKNGIRLLKNFVERV
jgi:glutamine amidotransferase